MRLNMVLSYRPKFKLPPKCLWYRDGLTWAEFFIEFTGGLIRGQLKLGLINTVLLLLMSIKTTDKLLPKDSN